MTKFLILYNAPESSREFMAQFGAEEQKTGMQSWINWKEQIEQTVRFEFGMPVESLGRLTGDGRIADSDIQASGYSIMEGDKEAVIAALKSHPHLERPGATIDVLEMLSVPGVDPGLDE